MSAVNVADDVATSCHISLGSFALCDVYDGVKEVCFPVLASEILKLAMSDAMAWKCK